MENNKIMLNTVTLKINCSSKCMSKNQACLYTERTNLLKMQTFTHTFKFCLFVCLLGCLFVCLFSLFFNYGPNRKQEIGELLLVVDTLHEMHFQKKKPSLPPTQNGTYICDISIHTNMQERIGFLGLGRRVCLKKNKPFIGTCIKMFIKFVTPRIIVTFNIWKSWIYWSQTFSENFPKKLH